MNANTNSRVALVTGATGAIGFAIANHIALMPGVEVVLLGRNEAKAKLAVGNIQAATVNRLVSYSKVDLSRLGPLLPQGRTEVAGRAQRISRVRLRLPPGACLQARGEG